MVFKAKGARTYKVRVDHPDYRHAILTTGCQTQSDASEVERIVKRWQGKSGKRFERLDVLDALIAKRITLPAAVDAYHDGTLDALVDAHRPPAPTVDLLALIDDAVAAKERSNRGAGQAIVYRKQLLALFPERPLTLELFTRREVWARLTALQVDAPTRNRYRTAASWLAKYLVVAEHLESNFVRDIQGFGENGPRQVYYELDDARRLIQGLAQPYAAVAAAMLGFCMEWTAVESWLVGDVTQDTNPVVAHVRGTKRAWRDRYVPLVPELAWTLDYIRPALAGKLPAARVFDDLPEWRVIRVIRATAKALNIVAVGEDVHSAHDLHDWRQTHTVALLRAGYPEQVAADHLGHRSTTLVREKYGRFRSTVHDYARTETATNSITSVRKHAKPRGVR